MKTLFNFLPLYAPADDTGAGAGAAAGTAAGAGAADTGAAAAAAAAAGTPAAAGTGAAAAAPAAGAAAETLAGAGAAGADAAAAAAAGPKDWPANWRDLMAEQVKPGDKAFRARLDRMTAPGDIGKSWSELEGKLSAGKLKAVLEPLPENATPEQKAEWRKAGGLPETPEAMVKGLKLPDGVVVGEADKPLVENFAKELFEKGGTQAEMDRAVSFYYQLQDKQNAALVEADGGHRQEATAALMQEWGGADYKVNMNAVGTLLAGMPDDLRVEMLTARTADGKMLGNTAAFNKWAAATARDINPAATLVPAGDGNAAQTIDNEIAAIEKTMYDEKGQANREYWGDEKKQARYRELVDAKGKMGARGKAA